MADGMAQELTAPSVAGSEEQPETNTLLVDEDKTSPYQRVSAANLFGGKNRFLKLTSLHFKKIFFKGRETQRKVERFIVNFALLLKYLIVTRCNPSSI